MISKTRALLLKLLSREEGVVNFMSDPSQKKVFDNMIAQAEAILKVSEKDGWSIGNYDRHPIYAFINLLGRKTQGDIMLESFYGEIGRGNSYTHIDYYEFMTCLIPVKDAEGIIVKCIDPIYLINDTKTKTSIKLTSNLVLPWPWHFSRLTDAMRLYDPWEERTNNHSVIVWKPFDICWVSGGNHSITSGIVKGHGEIHNAHVYDASGLLDHIYTDGLNYYSTVTEKAICPVRNVEFAAIFEIARKIKLKSMDGLNL